VIVLVDRHGAAGDNRIENGAGFNVGGKSQPAALTGIVNFPVGSAACRNRVYR
jgi:hypothetical protein